MPSSGHGCPHTPDPSPAPRPRRAAARRAAHPGPRRHAPGAHRQRDQPPLPPGDLRPLAEARDPRRGHHPGGRPRSHPAAPRHRHRGDLSPQRPQGDGGPGLRRLLQEDPRHRPAGEDRDAHGRGRDEVGGAVLPGHPRRAPGVRRPRPQARLLRPVPGLRVRQEARPLGELQPGGGARGDGAVLRQVRAAGALRRGVSQGPGRGPGRAPGDLEPQEEALPRLPRAPEVVAAPGRRPGALPKGPRPRRGLRGAGDPRGDGEAQGDEGEGGHRLRRRRGGPPEEGALALPPGSPPGQRLRAGGLHQGAAEVPRPGQVGRRLRLRPGQGEPLPRPAGDDGQGRAEDSGGSDAAPGGRAARPGRARRLPAAAAVGAQGAPAGGPRRRDGAHPGEPLCPLGGFDPGRRPRGAGDDRPDRDPGPRVRHGAEARSLGALRPGAGGEGHLGEGDQGGRQRAHRPRRNPPGGGHRGPEPPLPGDPRSGQRPGHGGPHGDGGPGGHPGGRHPAAPRRAGGRAVLRPRGVVRRLHPARQGPRPALRREHRGRRRAQPDARPRPGLRVHRGLRGAPGRPGAGGGGHGRERARRDADGGRRVPPRAPDGGGGSPGDRGAGAGTGGAAPGAAGLDLRAHAVARRGQGDLPERLQRRVRSVVHRRRRGPRRRAADADAGPARQRHLDRRALGDGVQHLRLQPGAVPGRDGDDLQAPRARLQGGGLGLAVHGRRRRLGHRVRDERHRRRRALRHGEGQAGTW